MKATLKFWALLSCAGLAVIGCHPIKPDCPNHNDENPPVERPNKPDDEKPDEPTEKPLTDGSLFTIQLNDEIMATIGTGTWNAIAYGNGTYVAVGEDGNIVYSMDGISWIRKYVGTDAWDDIVFNSKVGRFVAVGPVGHNGYSSDGISWTQVTIDHNYSAVGVEPNQNMFISVRSLGGYYGLSAQGANWSEYAKEGCDGVSVAAGNSELISVSNGKINIFKYPSWEKSIEVEGNYKDIVYNPDKNEFLAVGQLGYVAKSTDGGNSWAETRTNNGAFTSVDYSSELGMYVAICNGGKSVATSKDGINWNVKQISDSNSMKCLLIMQ